MKYKCLVFDHDDTVVNSTATIHQPAFEAFLAMKRPGMHCPLDEYFKKNFHPGFLEMCREDFGMSEEELAEEVEFWQSYVKNHIPKAYPGIKEIMERHKAEGGIICVVSHSFEYNIVRDYAANSLPEIDAVFGWGEPPERRKPNAYPLEEIMRRFAFAPSELLMIDDLKPGYDMASRCGVDFAAVGWSNDIPEIESFMRENCRHYFKSVDELDSFLR